MTWQLQEAKQRLSELVRKAEAEGPQVISRNGRDVVVVIAVEVEEFHRGREPKKDFREFLMSGPDFDLLDIERDQQPSREIDW